MTYNAEAAGRADGSRRMMAATILVVTLLFGLAGLSGSSARAGGTGAPDWDGDGAISTDCRPLDPAVHPGAIDHPDLAFEDLDCDGIDGDRDGAYFVMPAGSDANVGTSNAPFQTVQRAIDAARSSPTKSIYVATGTYNQSLSLPANADGIRIFGGYEAGSWGRTTATTTMVNGQPEALMLDGATDVVVQLVRLAGTRGTGASAYGVRAVNGSEIAFVRASASAGAGAAGARGDAGSQPGKAAAGADGQTPPNCDTLGAGGSGAPQGGNGFDGGAGGAGGNHTNDGENGQAGSEGGGGSPGGDGGPGGVDQAGDPNPPDWEGMAGKTGQAGADGGAGSNGSGGGSDFGNASTAWAGRSGTDGTNGAAGYGGGGGGGGAGRGSMTAWQAGAGGGQGGDGGAGGTKGFGGGWGGGSFGVYLYNSQGAVVDGSAVAAANGGAGGAGGTGGTGGEGGDGGAGGGVRTDCNKTSGGGGAGGKGGNGGAGGNGGGGSGGPSVGLLRLGTAAATVRGSTLQNGTAGAGGSGGGSGGQAGMVLPASASAPTDFDGDGMTDASDACVEVPRGTDANGDGCPDRAAALPDGDGDGVPNDGRDECPSIAAGSTDADHNGCPDATPTTTTGGTSDTGGTTGTTGGTTATTAGATATTTGGPIVAGPVQPPVGVPSLVLTFATQKLRKALAKGFALQGGCAQACLVQSQLVLSGKLAKRLRLSRTAKPVVVAKGSAPAPAGGTAQLKLKFTAAAKRRFARLRSVRLSLVATPSNANGVGPKLTRAVTLKR